MRRLLLGGVAAIAALLLGSIAVITVVTGGSSPPAPQTPATPPSPASQAATPVLPATPLDLRSAPLGGVPLAPPVIVEDSAPPPPPPGSWEAVPILAPRRGPVALDLERVQPRLSRCFTPEMESRYGRAPISQVKDAAPLQQGGVTVLLLQVEVAGDRLLIVDAPLESRGPAGAGTIACAQAVLRGETISAGGLPGGRHRVRLVLNP